MPWRFLFNRLRDLIQNAWIPLLLALVCVGGGLGFIMIADEVIEGETRAFDEWSVKILRQKDNPAVPIGPSWVGNVARDITAVGGPAVLALITFIVCGYLLFAKQGRTVIFVLLATIGGLIVSTVLKASFNRARPDLVPHLDEIITSSFPSGHAMMSACVYLTLGTILMRTVRSWRIKWYILIVASALTGLVGISRVYMGVHYPTDVLAGWCAGLAWAIFCWFVEGWLQRKGMVEQEKGEDSD